MLNLNRLRALQAVAQYGGVSAAAESLHFTPSAISQQLSTLETDVGAAVVERVGRGVRLTEAGRVLVEHAEPLLAAEAAARAAVERTRDEGAVTLSVGVFASVAAGLMPTLFAELARSAPQVRLVTREIDPDAVATELRLGHLDLSFLLDYPEAAESWRPDVQFSYVGTDTLAAALPVTEADPAEPTEPGEPVRLADLADRDWILAGTHTYFGRAVRAACRQAGFDPRVAHEVDEQATALALVDAGAGVTLVSDFGRPFVPDRTRIVPLRERISRRLLLAQPRWAGQRPAVRALVEAATRAMRQVREQEW